MIQTDLHYADLTNADLSGATIKISYFKNANLNNIQLSDDTNTDSCFGSGIFDRLLCNISRKVTTDSPPFYGKFQYKGRL
jgi:uncharacterized protein YjbI with pentapeptide repeats